MSTKGYSVSIPFGGGSGSPPAGDVNIYLDLCNNGNDANDGHDWTHAVRTWGKAKSLARAALVSCAGADRDVIINVDNSLAAAVPAGDVIFDDELLDSTRLHVVHPRDRWLVTQTGGTIAVGLITAEAGSGLASIVVGGTVVPALTDLGQFLELTNPASGSDFIASIVGVNVAAATYVIDVADADIPGAFDDGTATCRVVQPRFLVTGEFSWGVKHGAQLNVLGAAVVAPLCYAFGIRATQITVAGEGTGFAACMAKSLGGVLGNIIMTSPTGTLGSLGYLATPGGVSGLDNALQVAFGLHTGLLGAFDGCRVGNTGAIVYCVNGPSFNATAPYGNQFSGYASGAIIGANRASMTLTHAACTNAMATAGFDMTVFSCRIPGTANNACILASGEGSHINFYDIYVPELAGGPSALVNSEHNALVDFEDKKSIVFETVVAVNYPQIVFNAESGGRIEINDSISATWMGTDGILRAVDHASILVDGDVNMASLLGAGTDIVSDFDSVIKVIGSVVKAATNAPGHSGTLDVDHGSKFLQTGQGPTFTLTGPAPADWQGICGTLGLLHVANGSVAVIGTPADGAVGVGAGVAWYVKRGSQVWFGANGVVTGGTPIVVGSLAAAAFGAAAVLNDLPAAPAGTEELCVIGPVATP